MSPAQQPTSNVTASNLQAGARLALIGMIVNVAFAIIKITAGVFGNAYALIADGIESSLDVAGSIVIWGGLRFAARPPDATHPYGHGKAEPLAAIFVALGVLGQFFCRIARPPPPLWRCFSRSSP
jgi:cation diffusion facilitator family transporter